MVSFIKKIIEIVFYIPNLIFSIIGNIFRTIFFVIGEFFKGVGYLLGLVIFTALHCIWFVPIFMFLFNFLDIPIVGSIIGVLLAFKFAYEEMGKDTKKENTNEYEEKVVVTPASIKTAWSMYGESKKEKREEEAKKQADALRKSLGL